jgi:hypothetical protein
VEVAVGDPPLHLVLTMAGMNRSVIDVGGVEWKLSRRQ